MLKSLVIWHHCRLLLNKIWDTAGQEKYHSLGISFYKGSDCCGLVFDITNSKSFETVTNWREEFLLQAAPADPISFPFVLIGNKVDKEREERKVTTQKATQWCKMNGNIPYYETSAKESINVKEIFEQMAKLSIKNYNKSDSIPKPSPFQIPTLEGSKKEGCKC